VVVRLQEIEARVVRLEASRKANPYAATTYEETKAQRKLENLVGQYGSFAAVVAAMEATGDPSLQEGVRLMVKREGGRYGYTQSG
jgi:hypothetical protein